MSENGNLTKTKVIIYFSISTLSIISNFVVLIILKAIKSTYLTLLKLLTLFEIAFTYTKFILLIGSEQKVTKIVLKKIIFFLKITTFGKSFFNEEDLKINNESFHYSMKIIYLVLNNFLCLETMRLIKSPFTQIQRKIPIYIIISGFLSLTIYVISRILNFNIEKNFEIICKVLYISFGLLGLTSIIFVFISLRLNKTVINTVKNIFLIRHISYILCILILFFNDNFNLKPDSFIINILQVGIGLPMFIIKLSEIMFCRKKMKGTSNINLTSLISSNINVEFSICILVGLTKIFQKEKCDENKINEDKKRIYHSINYSNRNKNDSIIIEYENKIFSEIRKSDEITPEIMVSSFTLEKNKKAIEKVSESKGKSGSFFFYTHNKKFITKTISNQELKTILSIIEPYSNYINSNKDSIITKIYGVFTIVIKNSSSINIVLMQNLLNCSPINVHNIFDLKGSTVQRKTKNVDQWKNTQTLKDLDFMYITKINKELIDFPKDSISQIVYSINNDLNFLSNLELMDYSLLFIIVEFPEESNPEYKEIIGLLGDSKFLGHIYKSKSFKFIYIIGIIDYLQKYNIKKKIENKFKGLFLNKKEKNMISSVPPEDYSRRFLEFVTKNVIISGKENFK